MPVFCVMDNKIFQQNKKTFILLGILAVLLAVAALVSFFSKTPRVVSISPPKNSQNVSLVAPVIIVFDKKPDLGKLQYNFSPSLETTLVEKDTNLEISPKIGYLPQTTYVFSLSDKGNKQLVSISFQTMSAQGGYEVIKDAEESTKNYYPLTPFSPPDGSHFYFQYTGKLKLNVYLMGNKEVAQKEFLDFAKSKGVDLFTHQITYISPP